MENVKGLFFDVGGTVFDWKNTARENIQELADANSQSIDGEAFAYDWRQEMFKIHFELGKHRQQLQSSPGAMGRDPVL